MRRTEEKRDVSEGKGVNITDVKKGRNIQSRSKIGVSRDFPSTIFGCVMSSVIDCSLRLPPDSVVEFCVIRDRAGSLQIGSNSLLSHCRIDVSLLPEGKRSLPDGLIIHTVAVRVEEGNHDAGVSAVDSRDQENMDTDLESAFRPDDFMPSVGIDGRCSEIDPKVAYVTIAFRLNDDLKKSFESNRDFVCYFGRKISIPSIASVTTSSSSSRGTKFIPSFWNCRLFKAKATMEDAFASTMNLVWTCLDDHDDESPLLLNGEDNLFSVEDAVDGKDIGAMLTFRSLIEEDVLLKTGDLSIL